jgi:hypothetical protein
MSLAAADSPAPLFLDQPGRGGLPLLFYPGRATFATASDTVRCGRRAAPSARGAGPVRRRRPRRGRRRSAPGAGRRRWRRGPRRRPGGGCGGSPVAAAPRPSGASPVWWRFPHHCTASGGRAPANFFSHPWQFAHVPRTSAAVLWAEVTLRTQSDSDKMGMVSVFVFGESSWPTPPRSPTERSLAAIFTFVGHLSPTCGKSVVSSGSRTSSLSEVRASHGRNRCGTL